ncbi:MAG: ribonuclease HI family protein [Candidatus Micrarchaeaceae archaeon]
MKIVIFTDGASRGNPGKSASGYMVLAGTEKHMDIIFNGVATNNFAEYKAIEAALSYAIGKYGPNNKFVLFSDSKLVVNQIKGAYKVKSNELKKEYEKVIEMIKGVSSFEIYHTRRSNENISLVDKAINEYLDAHK